ncbi:MAG: alanine racemase [Rhodospirillales bacterium]|jgi:alanine racemase|nr:alanine racemase [Rhodospirillaceae bacterium]MDP6426831.1 alanine racemase [Rhodospirillales bacterium]MDP6643419.1 alanine racemase [Rhodospirillales bacterium]MDP6841837.1 alanine racemase [Rhodospirillales bacterium]|tara:strand:+ start:519 stop:1652 length:1134 start_codon:yes stop_codon:yes gene_type:complete
MTETSDAELTIDLGAVQGNYQILSGYLPAAELAAVVKADAYGLGMSRIAPALRHAGCKTFFVATCAEGIKLRAILNDADIHVFNGPLPGEEPDFTEARLVPVLNSLEQLAIWSAHCAGSETTCAADIQIDSGMTRLGLDMKDLARLESEPDLLAPIEVDVVLSHLACADQPEHPMNTQQLASFEAAGANIKGKRLSLASSSAIYLGPQYHFDLARAGAALYGVNPTPAKPNPMRQVIRIQGKILQVRSVDTPRSVGYGATHRATRPSKIATVAVGYADGYLRSLGNAGTAYIDSHEVAVVGRVSMDLTTLDVADVPDELLALGRPVDLVGPFNPVDRLARQAGTIGYEILTNIGRRYRRRYVGWEGMPEGTPEGMPE